MSQRPFLAWYIFTGQRKSYGIQWMTYWTPNWRIPRLFWVQAHQLCFARHGKVFQLTDLRYGRKNCATKCLLVDSSIFFLSNIVSMKFCSDSHRILCFPFYLNMYLRVATVNYHIKCKFRYGRTSQKMFRHTLIEQMFQRRWRCLS